jgi:hypothetical protein
MGTVIRRSVNKKRTNKRSKKQFGGAGSSSGSSASSSSSFSSAFGKATGLAAHGVRAAMSAYKKTGGIQGLTSKGGLSRLATSVAKSVTSNPKLSLLASQLQSRLQSQSQTQPNIRRSYSLIEPTLKRVSSLVHSKLPAALQSPGIQKPTQQIKKPNGLFSVLGALPRSATQNPDGTKSNVISTVVKPLKSFSKSFSKSFPKSVSHLKFSKMRKRF